MWFHYHQYHTTHYHKDIVESSDDFIELSVSLFNARRNLRVTCMWPKAERNETYVANLAFYKEEVAKYKKLYDAAVKEHPGYVYAEILDAMIVYGNNAYNRDATEEHKEFFESVLKEDAKRIDALYKKYPTQFKDVYSRYCTLAKPGFRLARAYFEAA